MKIAKNWRFLPLLFLLVGGCVHSMNPFYREKDLIFDAALLGNWCDPSSDKSDTNRHLWTFTGEPEKKSYQLNVTGVDNGEKVDMEFDIRLFELSGHRFLDIYPGKSEAPKPSEKYGWLAFFRPTHTVVRLPEVGKDLVMQILLDERMDKYIEKRSGSLRFEKYEGRFLLTGSTRQLQELLRESLRQTNWWDKGVRLTRCAP